MNILPLTALGKAEVVDLARNGVDNGVPLHEANVFPEDTTQHAWFTHAYWARHRELTEVEA